MSDQIRFSIHPERGISMSDVEESVPAESAPLVIALSGNIASTKTTVMKRLRKTLSETFPGVDVELVTEPVEEDWMVKREGCDLSPLQMSYTLPYGFSFPFQVGVVNWQEKTARRIGRKSRNPEHCAAVDFGESSCSFLDAEGKRSRIRPKIILIERTTDDGALFVSLKCREGNFSRMAVESYNGLLEHGLGITPDLVIYLNTTPEECLARKQRRARDGESTVGREFLSQLHENYEKLKERYEEMALENILELFPEDCSSPEEVKGEKTKLVDRVVSFLREKPRKLLYRTAFTVDELDPPSKDIDTHPYDKDFLSQAVLETKEKSLPINV